MPRLPVDGKRVIEHRITFGTKERDMIESAIASYQFNRVATPTVDLMKDVSGMTVFAAILIGLGVPIILPAGDDTMEGVTNAIGEGLQKWRKQQSREYVQRREEEGDPIDPGIIEYDPNNPTAKSNLDFIIGSIKELFTSGGYFGGY